MNPITFEELETSGITYEKSDVSSSSTFEINGITVYGSTSEGERYVWSMPRTTFQAGFSKESFGKSIVKIFKKELQTGDDTFDGIVYITTNDKDATSQFLENATARDFIADVVSQGGSVIVENERIQVTVDGALDEFQRGAMAQFVALAGNVTG